jgi:hypothetical protein
MKSVRLAVYLVVGAVLGVFVFGYLEFSSDTPTSEFSRRHAEELHRRTEDEKKDLEVVAAKLADEIAEERGLDTSLEMTEERRKKIEMLKIQYEAALIVGASNNLNIRRTASDLAEDAEECTRIIAEMDEIERRVRAIRESLDWEKQRELEKRLERIRKGDPAEAGAIPPPNPDFMDVFAKFYGAATDEDRLRWAAKLKAMRLSEEDILGICSYYDCLSDAKMKYLVVDILCKTCSQAAWTKLVQILGSEPDWPMKQMICYSLEGRHKELSLQPHETSELVRLYDNEPSAEVRERLARVIGFFAGAEQSDKLLEIAKTGTSEGIRGAAIEFLDVSKPAHRAHLLQLVRKEGGWWEKQKAWLSLWGALDPQLPTGAEAHDAGESFEGPADEVVIRLRRRDRPDQEVFSTLVAALRGELGDNDIRCWLMDEYLASWPAYWPDHPLDEIIKEVAATDNDEDVRHRASFLLQQLEQPQGK